jgi:hypothetical protein
MTTNYVSVPARWTVEATLDFGDILTVQRHLLERGHGMIPQGPLPRHEEP